MVDPRYKAPYVDYPRAGGSSEFVRPHKGDASSICTAHNTHVDHQPSANLDLFINFLTLMLQALYLQTTSKLLAMYLALLVLPKWQQRYYFPNCVSKSNTGLARYSSLTFSQEKSSSRTSIPRFKNTDIIQVWRISFLNVNRAVFATFLLPISCVTHIHRQYISQLSFRNI